MLATERCLKWDWLYSGHPYELQFLVSSGVCWFMFSLAVIKDIICFQICSWNFHWHHWELYVNSWHQNLGLKSLWCPEELFLHILLGFICEYPGIQLLNQTTNMLQELKLFMKHYLVQIKVSSGYEVNIWNLCNIHAFALHY